MTRVPDPRGVRVSLTRSSAGLGLDPIVVEPPEVPLRPAARLAGRGLLGGASIAGDGAAPPDQDPGAPGGSVVVDGEAVTATLRMLDAEHGLLAGADPDAEPWADDGEAARRILLLPATDRDAGGVVRREVVVGGWRVEIEIESAARAALRERARRGREEAGHSGPTDVRAIIPGVVVSVSVAAGDAVVAGQQLLAVEAMKMQNELRAPRDGTIERVAVGQGQTIEVGDLLLVIT
jgi:biotin carboxyl carrier protein